MGEQLEKKENESAYDHYNRLKYRVSDADLSAVFGPGEAKPEAFGFSGTINTEYWAPLVRLSDGESTGFTVRTGGRKLLAIAKEVFEGVQFMVDEYFHLVTHKAENTMDPNAEWPDDVHCIAVFPVTGGSEGHYIHVELLRAGDKRTLFMLGKTFQGMGHAKAMCSQIIDLLGC